MTNLFHIIRYSIYCHFFEQDPAKPEIYKGYLEFWDRDDTKEHSGDCLKENFSCLKCQADWIQTDAVKAFEAVGVTIKEIEE